MLSSASNLINEEYCVSHNYLTTHMKQQKSELQLARKGQKVVSVAFSNYALLIKSGK